MKISLIKQLVMAAVFLLMLSLPAWLSGKDAFQLLARIPLGFIALFILLVLLKWGAITLRWRELLALDGYQVQLRHIFPIVLAGDFISENTPTNLGNMACNILFFKTKGVPASTTAAYCNLTFMLDITAIFFLLFTFTLLALQADSPNLLKWAVGGLALITLMLSWMVVLLKHAKHLIRLMIRSPLQRLLPQRYHRPAHHFLLQFRNRLMQTEKLSLGQLMPVFLLSLIHWGIRLSLLYLAIIAIGGDASWATTAIVQFVGGLAGMLTFLPGGFPGTEISLLALLHTLHPTTILLPAILLWRLITHHLTFLTGGAAFFYLTNKQNIQGKTDGRKLLGPDSK